MGFISLAGKRGAALILMHNRSSKADLNDVNPIRAIKKTTELRSLCSLRFCLLWTEALRYLSPRFISISFSRFELKQQQQTTASRFTEAWIADRIETKIRGLTRRKDSLWKLINFQHADGCELRALCRTKTRVTSIEKSPGGCWLHNEHLPMDIIHSFSLPFGFWFIMQHREEKQKKTARDEKTKTATRSHTKYNAAGIKRETTESNFAR